MDCLWRTRRDGFSECIREGCGNVISADCDKTICYGTCNTGSTPNTQNLVTKTKRYAVALTKWTVAGQPTRSESEIAELLTICQACDHHLPDQEACGKCGCTINAKTQGWANKLAMATEHCPIGKW